MAGTKNPKNRCKSCGDTWYPRGRSRSLKCPSCGSKEVETVSGGGLFGLIILVIAGVIFFGNNKSETKPSEQDTSVPHVTSPTDSTLPAAQDTAQRAQDATESTDALGAVGTKSASEEQKSTAALPTSTTVENIPVAQERCSDSTGGENCSQAGSVNNNLF